MHRLLEDFTRLRANLGEERRRYEAAVDAITGSGADAGLVAVIRDVLGRFVNDIVMIGQRSVRIMVEVDSLRTHADQVATRGARIETIAQTTRVISLNARIEAQRVGQAGAVFRVVADEIKALANESGELSKAIRTAIAKQATSLVETHRAASELAATDLNLAVESHRHLEATIHQLSAVSRASSEALERIQRDLDAAIQAMRFEDTLDQLLATITTKLGAIRVACSSLASGEEPSRALAVLDRTTSRDAGPPQDVSRGSVDLF
ncbi:MAG TPA: methyl-accepting chemotaxis protein [Kofleriaceae bacterium]|nr:methyl-accepting chemotaxis protein [Kofleriaceae bacterium]